MRNHLIIFGIMFLLATGVGADEPITLKDFGGWVGAVAFSPDSHKLAVGVSDGGVSIWDANRGQKVDATPGLRAVAALAFTADGATLVRGCHSPVMAMTYLNRDQTKIQGVIFRPGVDGPLLALALSPNGGIRRPLPRDHRPV